MHSRQTTHSRIRPLEGGRGTDISRESYMVYKDKTDPQATGIMASLTDAINISHNLL